MELERNSVLSKVEVSLVVLALLLACMFSNNDMVSRMALPGVLLIVAVLSSVVRMMRTSSVVFGWPFVYVLLACGYFVARAYVSPVQSFGSKDIILVCSGCMAASVLSLPDNKKLFGQWLPWVAMLLIGLQMIPLGEQWDDPSYVPFREAFVGKNQISGFFAHQNFFAIVVGSSASALLSYALFYCAVDGKAVVRRIIWSLSAAIGYFLMFWAQSRGAWLAVLMPMAVIGITYLVVRGSKNTKHWKRLLIGGVVALVVFIGLVAWTSALITEQRGIEERGFFFSNARLDMLMLAFDAEPDNAWVGGGSRFFSYEALRVWDVNKMNNSLGDPRVVHNEYVEAYVNYGIVGLVLFLGLVGLVFHRTVLNMYEVVLRARDSSLPGSWAALQMAMFGCFVAIGIQCVVDFSLHVLPVMLILGVTIGVGLRSRSGKLIHYVALTGVVGLTLVLGKVSFSHWLAWPKEEKARNELKHGSPLAATYFTEVVELTDDFDLARETAFLHFKNAQESGGSFKDAEKLFLMCVELHPHDGVSFVMLGRIALLQKQFENAHDYFTKAISEVGHLEYRFGAHHWMGMWHYEQFLLELVNTEKAGLHIEPKVAKKRLKEALQYMSVKSGNRGYRRSAYETQMRNNAEAMYDIMIAREAAAMGTQVGVSGHLPASAAYLSHATRYFQRARRLLGAAMTMEDSQRMALIQSQSRYLNKRGVEVDKDLLKALKNAAMLKDVQSSVTRNH